MSLPYLPGHIFDAARDLRRQGQSVATLASRLGIDPEALANLPGERAAMPVTVQAARSEFDRWACERLADIL